MAGAKGLRAPQELGARRKGKKRQIWDINGRVEWDTQKLSPETEKTHKEHLGKKKTFKGFHGDRAKGKGGERGRTGKENFTIAQRLTSRGRCGTEGERDPCGNTRTRQPERNSRKIRETLSNSPGFKECQARGRS